MDNGFKIRNGVNVGVLAADPANPTNGDIYYNSASNKLREYINGAWRNAVDEDSTQTLTNKTLTSPVINTPTGITKADVGLGNVDNTSDATKDAAVATLTNKTLTSPVINSPTGIVKGDVGLGNVDNTSDATKNSATATLSNKQVQFSVSTDSTVTGSNATASAFTTGVVRLTNVSLVSLSGIPAGSAGQFLILENKTGNQISINNEEATATAANRIQTSNSSNVSMPNNATFAFTYDSTSSRWQLTGGSGSGSGSGSGKNYLSAIVTSQSSTPNTGNGNFEAGSTLGWGLGTIGTLTNGLPTGSPTFGSGASGNLSITTVSSGQLAGAYSLSYASSAATTQGNMLASDAFNIDSEDQGKVLTWKFYYKAQTNPTNANWSGTSSNSFGVAVYDVTNSSWLSNTGNFGMTQNSGVGVVTGSFQTGITTAQLRFVVYSVNATSGAITVYFDDFSVSPQVAANDSRTIVLNAASAATTSMGTTDTQVTGWSATDDSNAGLSSNAYTIPVSGYYRISAQIMFSTQAASARGIIIIYKNGTSLKIGQNVVLSSAWNTTASINHGFKFNAGDVITIYGSATTATALNASGHFWSIDFIPGPTAGDEGRVISARIYKNGTQTFSTETKITGWTVDKDRASLWDAANNRFNIPVSGDYVLATNIQATPGTTASQVNGFRVNGGSTTYLGTGTYSAALDRTGGSMLIPNLKAGDYVEIYQFTTASVTVQPGTAATSVSFFRLSGPSVIAATESVNARYTSTAGQSIPAGSTIIDFGTKDYDSHNAVTTGASWKFTAPISGKYRVTAFAQNTAQSWTAGNDFSLGIYKNSAAFSRLSGSTVQTSGTFSQITGGSDTVNLLAGDFIDVRLFHNEGSNRVLNNSAGLVHIAIERVGN